MGITLFIIGVIFLVILFVTSVLILAIEDNIVKEKIICFLILLLITTSIISLGGYLISKGI